MGIVPLPTRQSLVDQLHPMPHGQATAALQVGDATDVGAEDTLRAQGVQVAEFAVSQLFGQRGVEHAVSAR